MRAGGVSIFLAAKPLLFSGMLVSTLMIFLNETLVPKTTSMYHRVKWEEMDKQTHPAETIRQNISLRGTNNEIYHIGSFDGPHATMTDVLILGFGEGVHLKSRIDAKRAVYEDGQWVFYDGYLRVFDENDVELSAQAFNRTHIPLSEKPSDFLNEQKEPTELTIVELTAYVRQLRRSGADCHKELVELHNKIAFPFGCVILAILGVPWGWSMGKYSGVVLSFGICIGVAFVYIGGMEVGYHLGESGVLSPLFSVWTANLIFAALGPYLLFRKNR
jgi:lipopolysaccharide export system permease protein